MSAIDTAIPAAISVPDADRASAKAAPLTAALSSRSTHMPALDGIRGVAILLVLFHHYVGVTGMDYRFESVFAKIGTMGWCGVDLFFVLSGFLITGILYDAKGTDRALINFYGRRILRLFPLQYGVLIAILGIYTTLKPMNCLAPPAHRVWLWLYASNMVIAAKGWIYYAFDHFWSLAVEEQFYFVWPFVVLACSRRTLIRLCLALIAVALILRIAIVSAGFGWTPAYVLTPCRMDALALGGLVALLARGPGGLAVWVRAGKWIAAGTGAALGVLMVVRGELSDRDPIVITVGLSLVAVFFATIIGASAARKFPARIFDQPVLRTFGKYSYGIYIFQTPLDSMVRYSRWAWIFHRGSYLTQTAVALAVGIGGSFAIAWVSFHCFERHFLKLKRYFH